MQKKYNNDTSLKKKSHKCKPLTRKGRRRVISILPKNCIGQTLCHTLHLTILLFQTFSPNKSSNSTSL